MEKKVVEVVAEGEEGIIPLGIMNIEQAMTLPPHVDLKISHPEDEPGGTERFMDPEEFRITHAYSLSTEV